MKRSVVIVCLLLAAPHLSFATDANAAGPPELAGRTSITGTTTALARVVLPHAVEVPTRPFDNPVARISSTGQLAGVVLKQDVQRGGVELLALSIDPCDSGRCTQKRLEFVQVNSMRRKKITLPAGPYLLYLVADGEPTKVELRLPGLVGETSLRPTSRADSAFGELTPWAAEDNARVAYSASTTHAIDRIGLTLVALEIEVDAHVGGKYSSCLRPVPEDAPAVLFEKTCSGAVGGWIFVSPEADTGRALLVGLALEGGGRFAHGVSYQSAAAVTAVRAFGFSLSYERGRRGTRSFSSTFSFDERP